MCLGDPQQSFKHGLGCISTEEQCSDMDDDDEDTDTDCDDSCLPPSSFADGGAMSKPSSDLIHTFAPGQWLTDASVSHLEAKKLPVNILVLDAPTAYWLTMQKRQSRIRKMTKPLKIEQRELVLCPLNNSRERGHADGGSHWALLVWIRRKPAETTTPTNSLPQEHDSDVTSLGRFILYDSGGSSNMCQAQADRLAMRLAGQRVKVTLGECARQTNGHDCGMYITMFSEIILESAMQDMSESYAAREIQMIGRVPEWEKRLGSLTPSEVTERRADIFRQLQGAVADEDASFAPRREIEVSSQ